MLDGGDDRGSAIQSAYLKADPKWIGDLVRWSGMEDRVFIRTTRRVWLGFWSLRYWCFAIHQKCGKYEVAVTSGRIDRYGMSSCTWAGRYRYFKKRERADEWIARKIVKKVGRGYYYFPGRLLDLHREFEVNRIIPGQVYSGDSSRGARIPAVPNPILSRVEEEINPINDPVKVEIPPPPSDPPRMINGRPARKIQL